MKRSSRNSFLSGSPSSSYSCNPPKKTHNKKNSSYAGSLIPEIHNHLNDYKYDSLATPILFFGDQIQQPHCRTALLLSQRKHYRPWQNLERSLFLGLHLHHHSKPNHHSKGEQSTEFRMSRKRALENKAIV